MNTYFIAATYSTPGGKSGYSFRLRDSDVPQNELGMFLISTLNSIAEDLGISREYVAATAFNKL